MTEALTNKEREPPFNLLLSFDTVRITDLAKYDKSRDNRLHKRERRGERRLYTSSRGEAIIDLLNVAE